MKTRIFKCIILFLCITGISIKADNYKLASPNGKIEIVLSVKNQMNITISNGGNLLLNSTPLNLIVNQKALGLNAKVEKTYKTSVSNVITPVVKIKEEKVKEEYKELTISFKGNYSLILRAYNEGVAYRFRTNYKDDVIIDNEQLTLNIPSTSFAYLMEEKSFQSMSESPYICSSITNYKENSLFSLPCLFKAANGNFMLFAESALEDYPGLWMQMKDGLLQATLPQKPTKTKQGNCLSGQIVEERADYIAKTTGKRDFPWRVFVVTDSEKELITNQLVYLLGKPAEKGNYSWIEPGLATLDWWGRRNIYNTNFKGDVNTETHKYFVDFNSRYGLKYFVLDDGWSSACDLRDVNKNLDLDELSRYAEEKGVGLVFWAHAFALKQDVAGSLDFLKSKGAKGIKIDFFVRDDQDMINLFHEIAREALKREIIVDFHGVCKPFGLNRTYPNVLTSEGLVEFEMNGVTDWANPHHHTLLPFIRMVTGPMDYLPGTFNNAQKGEFHMSGNRPVGLGSRAHSISLAVLFESPLTMLPDSPADYLVEDECTRFLGNIPVVWDETKVINAKIGEYVVLARRSGKDWFLAAITNWDRRNLSVKLDFLSDGEYNLECIKDGVNTGARAIDYMKETSVVKSGDVVKMDMATGGGWIGKLSRVIN